MSHDAHDAAAGLARRYRIQTVARLTGLATALLRAWERRYRLVSPERGASGYREYTDEDVRVLKRVRRLMERGYTIGEVARFGRARLLSAENDAELLPARSRGADADLEPLVAAFVRAARRGDLPAAELTVSRAFDSAPLPGVLTHFVQPALQAVGDAWERNELSPGVEHVATALLRAPLIAQLHSVTSGLGPVQAVTAAAPDDAHELGALMIAVNLAQHGRRALHLGTGLPAKDLMEVVQLTRARLVAVSFVLGRPWPVLESQLGGLRAALPPAVELVVGGRALQPEAERVRALGFALHDDVRGFELLKQP